MSGFADIFSMGASTGNDIAGTISSGGESIKKRKQDWEEFLKAYGLEREKFNLTKLLNMQQYNKNRDAMDHKSKVLSILSRGSGGI